VSGKSPSKAAIEKGAQALYEEANPESGSWKSQSKATQETFTRYAEAALTGETSKEREPEGEVPPDDGTND
jgi:hypothetical protein